MRNIQPLSSVTNSRSKRFPSDNTTTTVRGESSYLETQVEHAAKCVARGLFVCVRRCESKQIMMQNDTNDAATHEENHSRRADRYTYTRALTRLASPSAKNTPLGAYASCARTRACDAYERQFQTCPAVTAKIYQQHRSHLDENTNHTTRKHATQTTPYSATRPANPSLPDLAGGESYV